VSPSAAPPQRRRPFYGWYIVSASSFAFFLGFGFIYSFGVFAQPIARMVGYDVEAVIALFAISYTVFQVAGFLTGFLGDIAGPRQTVAAGGVLLGLGLLASSRATNNIELAAAFGIGVGLGLACMYVPVTDVVGCWFVRNRGYAMGLTVAGMGLGNLLIPQLAEAMISAYGIRATLAVCGLVALISIPALSLVFVRKPEDKGLYPDGDREPSENLADIGGGVTLREALHSRSFWFLYASILFGSFAMFLPFAHLTVYASQLGIVRRIAAILVSLIGAGTLISRLVLGRILDRFAPRMVIIVTFGVLTLDMLLWLDARTPLLLGVFALIFGIAYSTANAVQPELVLDYFGEKHGGELLGLVFTAAAPGSLLGPTLAGQLFDVTGTYRLAIVVGAAAFALAMLSLCFMPKVPVLGQHLRSG
jgi:MFS family permease